MQSRAFVSQADVAWDLKSFLKTAKVPSHRDLKWLSIPILALTVGAKAVHSDASAPYMRPDRKAGPASDHAQISETGVPSPMMSKSLSFFKTSVRANTENNEPFSVTLDIVVKAYSWVKCFDHTIVVRMEICTREPARQTAETSRGPSGTDKFSFGDSKEPKPPTTPYP
jgi:hypothetical protein